MTGRQRGTEDKTRTRPDQTRPDQTTPANRPQSNHSAPTQHLPHNGNGSGSSCHQCKSRRTLDKLVICKNINVTKPPKSSGKSVPHVKQCRKKFCHVCLQKFYNERPPQHPWWRYQHHGTWTISYVSYLPQLKHHRSTYH